VDLIILSVSCNLMSTKFERNRFRRLQTVCQNRIKFRSARRLNKHHIQQGIWCPLGKTSSCPNGPRFRYPLGQKDVCLNGPLIWFRINLGAQLGPVSITKPSPKGPSIKYVTLFLANFYPLPLSHFVPHSGTPESTSHISDPPPDF